MAPIRETLSVGTYPVDDANANIWAGSHRVGWPKSLLKLSISLSVLRELAATGSLYAHPAEGGTSLCASLASAALRLGLGDRCLTGIPFNADGIPSFMREDG